MKAKHRTRSLLFAFVSLLSLACAFTSGLLATPTPPPTATATIPLTPTTIFTPTITVTPTPSYKVEKAGSLVRSTAGGFSFARIQGYDALIHTANAFLVSDDGKVTVYIYSILDLFPLTLQGMAKNSVESVGKNMDDFHVSDPVVQQDLQLSRVSVDFTGLRDDEPLHGRLTIFEPQNSKIVFYYVMAAGDQRWEREGQAVYETIHDSFSFFAIQAQDVCQAHKNPGYGASPGMPIKIGGGLRSGEQRITDYLDALLGPRGELVGYVREGTEEFHGVNLEKYNIEYGHTQKTLYFDIYSSAELRLPTGMNCSAPLPPTTP